MSTSSKKFHWLNVIPVLLFAYLGNLKKDCIHFNLAYQKQKVKWNFIIKAYLGLGISFYVFVLYLLAHHVFVSSQSTHF